MWDVQSLWIPLKRNTLPPYQHSAPLMPLTALLPLVAGLLGLAAGFLALGIAKAPGWSQFRSAAWPAFFAAAYCVGDLVIAYPGLGSNARFAIPLQLMAVGGYLAALSWYLPAIAGPHRLDRVIRAWGVGVGALGVVCLVPGLGFSRAVTTRELPWLHASYTESTPTGFGLGVMLLALLGMVPVIARTYADVRGGHPSLHVAGFCVLLLTGATDTATSALSAPIPYVVGGGFIITIGFGIRAVFVRFAGHAADLDAQTRSLAQRIDERTRELASANDRLHRAEKLAALGQLAAGVAHEVNNPSAAVVANLSYLVDAHARDGAFPQDAVAALQESITAMGRVARIVRQLLDAGRAGARHEVLEPVALAGAVESALAIVRPLIRSGITARSRVDVALAAEAREDLLVQALVNLLTNAIQAIPAHAAGVITVSATPRDEGRVELVVEDDGAGMSAEVRARVFEPFFTTKAAGGGTGLGLSVTLGIIRSLGGDVTIDSTPGHGTRVSIRLEAAALKPRSTLPPRIRSIAPTAKPRILIVDDERPVRDALRRVLQRTYDVRTAAGVEEALDDLAAQPDVDVVLCDVLMADGGGELLYTRLHARSPELARKIVFLTGGVPGTSRAFLESQPQPVLEKPLDVALLAAAVQKLDDDAHAVG